LIARINDERESMDLREGVSSLAAAALIRSLRFWRRWISPSLGSHCRFTPSCSAYAEEAVQRFGAARGSVMMVSRLLRCHPFHRGGLDPVPASSR